MFPRTTIFQKRPKNPLTCSRKRKVQKISPRHQSERLGPCGECHLNVAFVNLGFSGFDGLHPSCLLNLKS